MIDIMTGKDEAGSFLLCPKGSGAEKISRIYYYTGDFSGLEEMSADELKEVTDSARLMWSRSGN